MSCKWLIHYYFSFVFCLFVFHVSLNPVDRRAWWAIVHRVTRSQTRLKWLSTRAHVDSRPYERYYLGCWIFLYAYKYSWALFWFWDPICSCWVLFWSFVSRTTAAFTVRLIFPMVVVRHLSVLLNALWIKRFSPLTVGAGTTPGLLWLLGTVSSHSFESLPQVQVISSCTCPNHPMAEWASADPWCSLDSLLLFAPLPSPSTLASPDPQLPRQLMRSVGPAQLPPPFLWPGNFLWAVNQAILEVN